MIWLQSYNLRRCARNSVWLLPVADPVHDAVAANAAVRHIVIVCPAVNTIDASALESLEAVSHRLKDVRSKRFAAAAPGANRGWWRHGTTGNATNKTTEEKRI